MSVFRTQRTAGLERIFPLRSRHVAWLAWLAVVFILPAHAQGKVHHTPYPHVPAAGTDNYNEYIDMDIRTLMTISVLHNPYVIAETGSDWRDRSNFSLLRNQPDLDHADQCFWKGNLAT